MNEESLKITVPRLVVGGATSGVGKTTFVAGLIGALRRRGLRVAPFKVGPDYIDPSYHARLARLPCRNLDTWLVPPDAVVELFDRATGSADVAVVEGVMGLYDGRGGREEDGSTAEVAKLLRAPTILLVDVNKTARSAGAVVLGFRNFDPDLWLAGAVLNRVGSPAHGRWVQEAVEAGAGVPVLGYLPRRDDLVLPERHLGLIPTGEVALADDFVSRLIDQIEATVAVDRLLDLARSAGPLASRRTNLFPAAPVPPRVRIGLALDRAFTFYYEDNLDLLRAWGADLVPFSPLADAALPESLDGLYIGGGFPELFAVELARNHPMLRAIRGAVAAGLPVYAECGGLMYLSEGIVDFEGRRHPLVGVVPVWSAMTKQRLTMGYRTAIARSDNLLLRRGERVRGHEFHWSETPSSIPAELSAYEFAERPGSCDGYARGRVLASYLHVHFASRPDLAPRFIAACNAAGSCATKGATYHTIQVSPQLPTGPPDSTSPAAGGPVVAPPCYPVCLNVAGKSCVVVGGGKVAERKVLSLLAAGAGVLVVSPELTPRLRRLRDRGNLEHVPRVYREGDLAQAFLVIAATDDRAANDAVAAEAARCGILVNVVDDPARCSFILPAVLRRGSLLVSVSTSGHSPAVARFVREELERFLSPEFVTLLEVAAETRAALRARGRKVSPDAWRLAVDGDLLALIRRGDLESVRSALVDRLRES